MESLFESVRIAGSRSSWQFRKEELLKMEAEEDLRNNFPQRLLVRSQCPLIYQQEVLGGTVSSRGIPKSSAGNQRKKMLQ